jgi:DNA-binding response OmpR family regulator/HPt (histidine-containing phosphotransfer) domain-containing protein
MRILVVEDDDILLTLLTARLSAEHYALDSATDGLTGWEYASTYDYDLLILDVVLPKLDGISLCQKLRQAGYTLPILMLTSQDTSMAKILGLDAGADDYVVKPFDPAELTARVRALLRRGSTNPLPIMLWGDLCLNSSTQEVSYAGTLLDLTAKEYGLLEMMLRESQRVFSKDEILDCLWSAEEFPVEATVRSHMRRLRGKLVAVGAPADLIATSHGRGYYLKPVNDGGFELSLEAPPPIVLAASSSDDQQAQYLEFLNQTWQDQRSNCLQRVHTLDLALDQLQTQALPLAEQSEAYRLAHNLVGTLGTFGLAEAMAIARSLEQEFHPDIYLEPSQVKPLKLLLANLQQQIETTDTLVNLPKTTEAEPLVGNAQSGRSPMRRLMLVDDDPIFLQTLSKQLSGYGFQVGVLDDPQQFWAVLEGLNPDVLILDIQMPQMNGLELCQSLRSAVQWQKLPVLFLSAFADAQTQHQAFAAGADDYLCKPITVQDLSDRIHHRIQRIQAVSQ